MSSETLKPCGECGMLVRPNEYHPYAACLMFKGCRDSGTVRMNLGEFRRHAREGAAQEPVATIQLRFKSGSDCNAVVETSFDGKHWHETNLTHGTAIIALPTTPPDSEARRLLDEFDRYAHSDPQYRGSPFQKKIQAYLAQTDTRQEGE